MTGVGRTLPKSEITALIALIQRLEETRPLTELERFYKERPRKRRMKPDEDPDRFRAELHKAIEISARTATLPKRNKAHPVFGDTNYALGYQVQVLNELLNDWFAWAHFIPPSPSDRIKAILKRTKEPELRERFIAAYDKHFSGYWKAPIERPPSGDAMRDILQEKVPRMEVSLSAIDDIGSGELSYHFNFHCVDCGGWMFTCPEDDNEDGPVVCKACEQVLGTLKDMKALANYIGDERAKQLNLK